MGLTFTKQAIDDVDCFAGIDRCTGANSEFIIHILVRHFEAAFENERRTTKSEDVDDASPAMPGIEAMNE